jgi:hypothetical protein
MPKESQNPAKEKLEIISSDVFGPLPTTSYSGYRYILCFTDHFTEYSTIELIKSRSEVPQHVMNFVQHCITQFGRPMKIFRSDRAPEYRTEELSRFLKEKGVIAHFNVPHTSAQNGVSERYNRTLVEATRTVMKAAKAPEKLFCEAAKYCNYSLNEIRGEDGKTPFERFYERTRNLPLFEFGRLIYAWKPIRKNKMDSKSAKYMFVGYDDNSKGYRLFQPDNRGITISKDVKLMTKMYYGGETSSPSYEIDVQKGKINDENVEVPQLRRSSRVPKPTKIYGNIATTEPNNFNEAINSSDSEQWKKAMDAEYQSLIDHQTYDLVEPPEGAKILTPRWVYKVKTNSDGNYDRHKARLAVRGFDQRYGEDYDLIYAPVLKSQTFRALLSIAGAKKMKVHQLDVNCAFLNGILKETIYMHQPEGYVKDEKLVCKLRRGLYGLKQSARAWNETVSSTITQMGFNKSRFDPCLFSRDTDDDENAVYLLVYVDDLLVISKNDAKSKAVIDKLMSTYQMKSLGEISYFLGMKVQQDKNGNYMLSQEAYINKIASDLHLENCKPSKIPIDIGFYKLKGEPLDDDGNKNYRKIIGKLLYLATNTRLDIAAPVSILAQKLGKATSVDMTEAKRVIRYCVSTKDYKLKLSDANMDDVSLHGYSDADWGECPTDRRSNNGYVFMFNGGVIDWTSRKQSHTASSTAEAELIALNEAAKNAKFLRMLLTDIGVKIETPIMIYIDSQSCEKMLDQEAPSARTKHLDIRRFVCIDMRNEGIIETQYVPSEHNLADILTKPVSGIKIKTLTEKLNFKPFN